MKTILIALKIFLFFTVLTGVVYPLFVTAFAQFVFPSKANGSIILSNNKTVGSVLIGQQFDSAIYFSSRPSATAYNSLPSGGSNYGVSSSKLKQQFDDRKTKFITDNELDSVSNVPSEMLFASGSGLDPHISPEAALFQVNKVVKARHFDAAQKAKLMQCIADLTQRPQFFCLGQARINVLLLNLETDKIQIITKHANAGDN